MRALPLNVITFIVLKFGSILDKTAEEIAEHYGPIVLLLQQKKKDANNLFVAANKIFYNKDYIKAISPKFLRLTKKYYGVNSLESLDFAQAEASAKVYYFYFLAFGIVEF